MNLRFVLDSRPGGFRSNARIAGAVAIVLAMLSATAEESSEPARGMLPLEPKALLEFLPEEVEEWEQTRSRAETTQDGWIRTVAERRFERTRPDAEEEAPPMVARLEIEDTGGYAPARALFVDFAPEVGEGYEKKLLDGFPAVLIDYGSSGFSAEVLVAERFLVRVLCENQPKRFLGEWLKRVSLRRLSRVRPTEEVPLPESFTASILDEMDPSRSTSYELSTASGELPDLETGDPLPEDGQGGDADGR